MADSEQEQRFVAEPDVVTQLQTCLDQLATQFYASLRYITTRHPLSAPIDPLAPLPPSIAPPIVNGGGGGGGGITTTTTTTNGGLNAPATGSTQSQSSNTVIAPFPPSADPAINPLTGTRPDGESAPPPLSPHHAPLALPEFLAATRELAQDLVAKQKQIERLCGRLPILSEEEDRRQEERLKELEAELKTLELQVGDSRRSRNRMRERVEEVIGVVATGKG